MEAPELEPAIEEAAGEDAEGEDEDPGGWGGFWEASPPRPVALPHRC